MTRNFTVMQKIPLQIRVGRREKFEVDSSPVVQEVHHGVLCQAPIGDPVWRHARGLALLSLLPTTFPAQIRGVPRLPRIPQESRSPLGQSHPLHHSFVKE